MNTKPSIKFLGACGTVTGSRYLVESGDDNLLIDCGLFQGTRETKSRNWDPFPHPAQDIRRIVITHAHIDHSGYLPRLVRNGFSGKVHATNSTKELLGILLTDAAMLQEEDAAFYNRRKLSRHEKALPLYTSLDARRALQLIIGHEPYKMSNLGEVYTAKFIPIGHILGACMIHVEIGLGGDVHSILFSGDVGRYDVPVLKDPNSPPDVDTLLIDSTYGDRLHQRKPSPMEELEVVVNRVVSNKGVLLIPAFAVGRTQDILYHLAYLESEKRIPEIPVFVDSPMATSVTGLYSSYPEQFDPDVVEYMRENKSFVHPQETQFVQSPSESRNLNEMGGPMVIISASGMLSGGRIRHHLYHHISDPSTEILFVGYQAEGTRGRQLVEGAKTIYIFKEELQVRAKVSAIEGFSAHADYGELLRWIDGMHTPPKRIFVVHGEDNVRQVFAEKLRERFRASEVIVPGFEDKFFL